MVNKINQPDTGERTVAARELVEDELDLVVGGEKKKTETRTSGTTESRVTYYRYELANVMVTS